MMRTDGLERNHDRPSISLRQYTNVLYIFFADEKARDERKRTQYGRRNNTNLMLSATKTPGDPGNDLSKSHLSVKACVCAFTF